jgi:phospholipase/carboxylesterase
MDAARVRSRWPGDIIFDPEHLPDMNRLASFAAAAVPLSFELPTQLFDASTTPDSPRRRLSSRATAMAPNHALFAPMHYERNYAYPLLVWLHDEGGNERELRRLMPHVSVRNYVGAAVRGVEPSRRVQRGYSWGASADAAGETAQRVRHVMDLAAERFNLHARRMFIAGFGSGGTMALRLAMENPSWFAGAASLSGPAPRGRCPLARVNEARQVPLFLASCRDSHEYPPTRVSADLRLLYSAGFSLALRQYPCPRELTTAMLSDMDRWLMQQVCPETAAAPSS